MKKILSVVLLLAMCLSLFAGCNKEDNSAAALESAKDYLEAAYKDEDAVTGTDYQRGGVVMVKIDGVDTEFKVTWTTNSDKVEVVADGKYVTIQVPYDNLEDLAYTLTATISDANGNSVQVSFDRTVPARPGIPTDVEDGTYVIVADGKSYTSLTEDKSYGYNVFHEVTVENGTVSGHYKADVLTITNVDGGFTIQDAYGRYIFMKDSHNSCNVSAEAPEEGHIWQLLTDKDGNTFIINTLKMKILAFDTGYSSWGAYPEITETRLSKIQLIKATAPETDPEPETPDVPDVPAGRGEIETPVAGTAYKLGMFQVNKDVMLYFTGLINQESTPWYMKSTENVAEAIDVFVEEVEGGLRLYFTIEGTKTYLDMHKDGTHYSLRLTTEPTAVYTWNEEHKTFVAMVEDKECFIGTSGTYTTFSCNKLEQISSSFVAHLYPQTGAVMPETPDEPEQPAGVAGTLADSIANGDKVVIYYPNGQEVLTGTASGNKLAGAAATVTENALAAAEAAVFEVIVDANGYYTFVMDGKYLTAGATGNSLTLADEAGDYSLWTLETAEGGFYIKSVNAAYNNNAQYMEYYNGFTTYGFSDPTKADIYTFQFFKVDAEGGETPEQPTDVVIADGSYLLIVDGKGMTALAENKGYGYMPTVDIAVADGVATGYTNNEIIVIKNVAGGFTMQDCYGRYIYMSGNYANFNVSADVPAEGHIWTATATEGGYIITNVLKGKNLVYGDGGYTTFGAYADKSSVVSVIAATATEQPEQPETPEQPEQPEEPEQPETPEVTGTATLATEVAVGDKIVLVNAAGDSAMGAQDETKRVVTAITVTDGVANLTADVVIITLEAGSQEGTFALKVDGGYLAYSGSGNTIATQETVDDAASWTITIVDGVVSIQNVAHTDRFLQYNISAPRFVCYKGTQEAPVIYKVEE